MNILFRPYFEALIQALECNESDQLCFYALSVLLTMTTNRCKFINFFLFPKSNIFLILQPLIVLLLNQFV